MTTNEFEALCTRVMKDGNEADRQALVRYAIELRLLAVVHIDQTDTWDQEWPQLSYGPYDDNRGEVYDETRAWAKTYDYSRWV